MDLYFTRHGKTEWNSQERFQGSKGDSPLLPESYLEIEQLGQRLQDIPFTAIYTSPQKRALTTAQGIATQNSNVPMIIQAEGLREIGMGELEGVKIEEARKQYNDTLNALRYHPDTYNPTLFHGETYEAMVQRSQNVVLEAIKKQKGPLLFVSHGATLTGLIQTLSGKSIADARKMGGLGNNTLNILRVPENSIQPPFKLVLWNDSSHLIK